MRLVDLSPGDPRLEADALPVLLELRPELTPRRFADIYAEGHPQGLRFTALYDDGGPCVAVAGWRVVATTVAGRKLYVDDLVTSAGRRGEGHGAALLRELEERAREAGCSVIDLDSGMQRSGAHRFYAREHMAITSLHFAKRIEP